MGFNFRKSIKVGPARVNFSKSGVGYSVGGKGFRMTKKAGGGTRTTVGIPGTGISYSKDSSRKSKSSRASNKASSNTSYASATYSDTENAGDQIHGTGCFLGCMGFCVVAILLGLVVTYWKRFLVIAVIALCAYIAYRVIKSKYAAPPVGEDGNSLTPASANEGIPDALNKQEAAVGKEPESEVKVYQAAGVEYYLDDLMSMMVPNYLYDYKKQELIDTCNVDRPIYRQTIDGQNLRLVPEPDNPHDPNAITIMIGEKKVGYIATKDCAHLLNVINNDLALNVHCEVSGGKYKMVNEDYDCEKDKSHYTMEYGEDSYGITLYIREKLQ